MKKSKKVSFTGDLEVYVICDLSQALTSDFEPGTFNFKFMYQDEDTFGTWQTALSFVGTTFEKFGFGGLFRLGQALGPVGTGECSWALALQFAFTLLILTRSKAHYYMLHIFCLVSLPEFRNEYNKLELIEHVIKLKQLFALHCHACLRFYPANASISMNSW